MVRDGASGAIEEWFTQAKASPSPASRQFARGIAEDKAAVMAAMARRESTGQVEGHITRASR